VNEGTTQRTIDVEDLRLVALGRIKRRRNFGTHVFAYLVGSLTLAVVWSASEYQNADGWPTAFRTGRQDHDWDPWIMYPLIAGAVALAVHAWIAFGRRPVGEQEIAQEIERLRVGGARVK
jgi:hypothetical protein